MNKHFEIGQVTGGQEIALKTHELLKQYSLLTTIIARQLYTMGLKYYVI